MTTPGSEVGVVAFAGLAATPASSPRLKGELPRGLTAREVEVLATYAHTHHQGVAAERLGITLGTLKGHLTNIYERLDVDCVIQAFAAVGWLRVPPDHLLELELDRQDSLAAASALRAAIDRFVESVSLARKEAAA
jgi:DNA-binding CsgD family transcriptional regulator